MQIYFFQLAKSNPGPEGYQNLAKPKLFVFKLLASTSISQGKRFFAAFPCSHDCIKVCSCWRQKICFDSSYTIAPDFVPAVGTQCVFSNCIDVREPRRFGHTAKHASEHALPFDLLSSANV